LARGEFLWREEKEGIATGKEEGARDQEEEEVAGSVANCGHKAGAVVLVLPPARATREMLVLIFSLLHVMYAADVFCSAPAQICP
jgi:hypothetical protein